MSDVAIEHIMWAASNDFCPDQVLESIDVSPPNRPANWEDVAIALRIRHRDALEKLASRRDERQLTLVLGGKAA